MTETQLIDALSEIPIPVDEGGLEFKNAGIRVWFDENGTVNQIFVFNSDVNFYGVKIGGKIGKFK